MNKSVIILLIITLLQSCSSMYIPSVRSIPLLEQAGEFQGETGVSTNSVYANGSFALSDKMAATISGNLSYGNFTDSYDIFTVKHDTHLGGYLESEYGGKFTHRYGEVSLGRINMTSPARTPKLEIFGGLGVGKAKDNISGNALYDCNYYSFFGQGNFGIKKRVVEAGVSLRITHSRFNYNAYFVENNDYTDNFYAFHLEPMGFARIGRGNVKVVFRYGINIPFASDINESTYSYYGFDVHGWDFTLFHLSIGLSYRIGGK